MSDERDQGEKCDRCGKPYWTVYRVPDDIWEKVKPFDSPPGAGLLCIPCVEWQARRLHIPIAWVAFHGDTPLDATGHEHEPDSEDAFYCATCGTRGHHVGFDEGWGMAMASQIKQAAAEKAWSPFPGICDSCNSAINGGCVHFWFAQWHEERTRAAGILRAFAIYPADDGAPCWCDADEYGNEHSEDCQAARAYLADAEGKRTTIAEVDASLGGDDRASDGEQNAEAGNLAQASPVVHPTPPSASPRLATEQAMIAAVRAGMREAFKSTLALENDEAALRLIDATHWDALWAHAKDWMEHGEARGKREEQQRAAGIMQAALDAEALPDVEVSLQRIRDYIAEAQREEK